MRTFLLLLLLSLTSIAAQAQGLKNKTNCALRLVPMCYMPAGGGTCTGSPCGLGILVPAQGSVSPLPACTSGCMDGYTGYRIVYDGSTGCNMSADIGNPGNPCPPFGTSAVLPGCPGCGGLTLTITYVGADILVED